MRTSQPQGRQRPRRSRSPPPDRVDDAHLDAHRPSRCRRTPAAPDARTPGPPLADTAPSWPISPDVHSGTPTLIQCGARLPLASRDPPPPGGTGLPLDLVRVPLPRCSPVNAAASVLIMTRSRSGLACAAPRPASRTGRYWVQRSSCAPRSSSLAVLVEDQAVAVSATDATQLGGHRTPRQRTQTSKRLRCPDDGNLRGSGATRSDHRNPDSCVMPVAIRSRVGAGIAVLFHLGGQAEHRTSPAVSALRARVRQSEGSSRFGHLLVECSPTLK